MLKKISYILSNCEPQQYLMFVLFTGENISEFEILMKSFFKGKIIHFFFNISTILLQIYFTSANIKHFFHFCDMICMLYIKNDTFDLVQSYEL